MKPRIIALLGSPLIGGNTAKLLDQAVRGAEDAGCEVEKIIVPFLNFNPCMELFFCVSNETCRMKDDITPIYEKFRDVDGVIIASPVMTMGIPGKLKAFMDRFQVFFMAKYMRKQPLVPAEKRKTRKGLYIAISGMNLPTVFDGAKMTVKAFFEIIDVAYEGELLIRDMDTVRDITTRPDCIKAAYRKGKELGTALIAGA
ncbi:MAG: flavodoxin family protein [Methanoregulaceae archaeon]|nr:flavodoxin family protein [Methanoregulaceae archaeon]